MADATRAPEPIEFELVGGEHDGARFHAPKVPRGWQVPVHAPIGVAYWEPSDPLHFCGIEYDMYEPTIVDYGYSMSDEGVYRLRLVSSVRCECRGAHLPCA